MPVRGGRTASCATLVLQIYNLFQNEHRKQISCELLSSFYNLWSLTTDTHTFTSYTMASLNSLILGLTRLCGKWNRNKKHSGLLRLTT